LLVAPACSSRTAAHMTTSTPEGSVTSPVPRDTPASSPALAAAPDLCGPWSAVDSAQARAIVTAHGTLASCELVGRTWMVTAVSETRPGQVGLFTCNASDAACMNGALVHDLTTFTWIAASANAGPGLKTYGGSGPAGPIFVYVTRHHGQVMYDLRSRSFTVCAHGICHW
jgi:hypothetical protein